MNRKYIRTVFYLLTATLSLTAPTWAQESVPDRIDKLEQEIAELKKVLQVQQQQQQQHQAEQQAE